MESYLDRESICTKPYRLTIRFLLRKGSRGNNHSLLHAQPGGISQGRFSAIQISPHGLPSLHTRQHPTLKSPSQPSRSVTKSTATSAIGRRGYILLLQMKGSQAYPPYTTQSVPELLPS